MGESQEIRLWEDNTKEAGGQAEVTFLFSSIGFPGRSIWTDSPPHNSGFMWVMAGLCASCSRSPNKACSILLLQGNNWEAGGMGACRITCSWPGNLVIKTPPLSQNKLFYFMG